MQRVKIMLPEKNAAFSCRIPVRITDLNYGKHVGNDAFLSLIHEARVQFLASGGFTEMNAGGVGLIMSDAMISYHAEVFYGEEIHAEVFIGNISRNAFDLYFALSVERECRTQKVVLAKTGMVGFEYERRKVVRLPENFERFLSQDVPF